MKKDIICWWSGGVTSAVAIWLALVFLVKHPDYPNNKSIFDMPDCKVEPLFECNGYCGTNDLKKNKTELEINFN